MNSQEYKIYMDEQIKKMKAQLKKKKHEEITKAKKQERHLKYQFAENYYSYLKYKNLLNGNSTRSMEDLSDYYKEQVEILKKQCEEKGLI